MTPPSDLEGSAPAPVPAAGTARLFLLCDSRLADAALTSPAAWGDFLSRLGLSVSPRADGSASHLQLCFAGLPLTLLQAAAAQSALDETGRAALATTIAPEAVSLVALECDDAAESRSLAAQRMCALAALLGQALGARQLYWQPARLWSSTDALADAVVSLEAMGMPPILHLVAFESMPPAPEGATGQRQHGITSRGLDWFCGYELQIAAPPSMTMHDLARRAARLAIDSLLNGDPVGPVDLPGLVKGETVHLGKLECRDGRWWLPVVVTHGERR